MFVFFQVHKSLWCGCEFIFGTFFFKLTTFSGKHIGQRQCQFARNISILFKKLDACTLCWTTWFCNYSQHGHSHPCFFVKSQILATDRLPWKQHVFLVVPWPFLSQLQADSQPNPLVIPFFGAMIKISTRVEIQYKEEKPVMIPGDLIRHCEEKQYLQLRPTCRPIIQLVCGHTVAMNASLSQCSHLMELITIRNQNFKSQAEKAEEASSSNGQGNQEAEDLFGNQENVKPPQKRWFHPCLKATSNGWWLLQSRAMMSSACCQAKDQPEVTCA